VQLPVLPEARMDIRNGMRQPLAALSENSDSPTFFFPAVGNIVRKSGTRQQQKQRYSRKVQKSYTTS
jgi:hypothetical protein